MKRLALLALSLLWACAHHQEPPIPTRELPQAFPYAERISLPKEEARAELLARWWEAFGDPQLVRLVEEALKENPSVEEALARIEEARALKGQGTAGLFPQVTVGTSVRRQGGNTSPYSTAYSTGADASWGLDVFGKTRKRLEGLGHDLRAEEEGLRGVRSSLAAEVATEYLELCALQGELSLLRERLKACEAQYRDLVLARYRSGLSDETDLVRAEREMASLEAEIRQKEGEIEGRKAALCALLGKPPGCLGTLEVPQSVPLPPLEVILASPAEVLERRLDVRKAKELLLAQLAYLEEAKRDRLPVLKVLGSVALQALTLGDLLRYPVLTLEVGPSLDLELFTGGGKRSQIKVQEAKVRQAMAQYEEAVLGALKEAQEALASIQTTWDRIEKIQEAVEASKGLLEVQEHLYAAGLKDYEGVIEERRSLYELKATLVKLKGELALGFVELFQALGGGWEEEEGDG